MMRSMLRQFTPTSSVSPNGHLFKCASVRSQDGIDIEIKGATNEVMDDLADFVAAALNAREMLQALLSRSPLKGSLK